MGLPAPLSLTLPCPTCRSKSQSEMSLEGFGGAAALPVAVPRRPARTRSCCVYPGAAGSRAAGAAGAAGHHGESAWTESLYSFDSRAAPPLPQHPAARLASMLCWSQDEGHLFYITPAIPEENPSLSSRTELLAADSLSKHSQDTQPLEAALGSGAPPSGPQRRGQRGAGGRRRGSPQGGELALQEGRLGDSPVPAGAGVCRVHRQPLQLGQQEQFLPGPLLHGGA